MGSSTGSALASILGVLLSSGSIDLGNIGNIIPGKGTLNKK